MAGLQMRWLSAAALGLALSGAAGPDASASIAAATYDFSVTVDGTTATVDPGTTDPAGVNLLPGDCYILDLHASAGNMFRVDTGFTQSFPLTFIVNPSGIRTGDVTASFLLDGNEVLNLSQSGIIQSEVHIGAENWTLPAGLEFDSIAMTYDLLSAVELESPNTVDTTIRDQTHIFGDLSNPERPFFRNSNVSFVPIPEPTTLGITALALVMGLGSTRRRSA